MERARLRGDRRDYVGPGVGHHRARAVAHVHTPCVVALEGPRGREGGGEEAHVRGQAVAVRGGVVEGRGRGRNNNGLHLGHGRAAPRHELGRIRLVRGRGAWGERRVDGHACRKGHARRAHRPTPARRPDALLWIAPGPIHQRGLY
eukprot:1105829-Prorocentrum_minimum.AAC.1